jgi:aryl carrier-like protein
VCDLADREALARVLADFGRGAELNTVVHAETAGVTGSGRLVRQAVAVSTLHELTRGIGARALVLLGESATAFAGTGAAAAPGVAQAFRDALAARVRAEGGTAVSLSWGPWEAGAGADPASAAWLRPLAPGPAAAALSWALEHGHPQLVVADVDWDRVLPEVSAGGFGRVLDGLPEVRGGAAAGAGAGSDAGPGVLRRLAAAGGDEQAAILCDLLRAHAAAILGHATAEAIAPDVSFLDLGFSSFTALELTNRLLSADGIALDPLAVYEHPTVEALALHLRDELAASGFEAAPAAEPDHGPDHSPGQGPGHGPGLTPAAPAGPAPAGARHR